MIWLLILAIDGSNVTCGSLLVLSRNFPTRLIYQSGNDLNLILSKLLPQCIARLSAIVCIMLSGSLSTGDASSGSGACGLYVSHSLLFLFYRFSIEIGFVCSKNN